MVARIRSSKSITRALNYNEQKMKNGVAKCLHAANFLATANRLSFRDKLHHFQKLQALNERVETNTVHISLSFHPGEKLAEEKLVQIAEAYMEGIGFEQQPYLVYQHFDAAHPHVHIVSTNIQFNGSRLSLHNLGRNQSEKARKEIELSFGLMKAEKGQQKEQSLQPLNTQRVAYGKTETKQAIANVLGVVVTQYKFSSLAELNAVLRLYNVVADRGEKDSIIYRMGGLNYRVLDARGNATGVPIKASLFHMKPTLKNLEQRFKENKAAKQLHTERLRTAIKIALIKQKQPSVSGFIKTLEKDGVSTVLRENKEGFVYGITYVDHKTKCVFNGSELGKEFGAKMILERCGFTQGTSNAAQKEALLQDTPHSRTQRLRFDAVANSFPPLIERTFSKAAFDHLLKPEDVASYLPQGFKKKKKKRKGQAPN